MFAKGQGDRRSIPSRVIPKSQKIVLDVSLLNTQHYMVRIKGNWSNTGKEIVVSIENGAFGSHSTTFGQLKLLIYIMNVQCIYVLTNGVYCNHGISNLHYEFKMS